MCLLLNRFLRQRLTVVPDLSLLSSVTVLIYILLCLIWGSTWIAIKIGLSTAPPIYSLSFRFGLAIVVLFGIIMYRKLPLPKKISDWWRLGVPGLFMYGASYAFIYFAEQYINSALTSVLFSSFPLFVALLSIWLLKAERLSLIAWGGLVLGMVGIGIISYDSLQTSGDLFRGSLLALSGSFAAAYGVVIHKRSFSAHNIIVSAFIQMIMGWIPLTIYALLFESWAQLQWTSSTILSIAYLAIPGTVITFLGYYWLLARTRAVIVSLIAFIIPLIAILIGVVGFDESLSLKVEIGTILVLASVLMVVKKKPVPVEFS